MLSDKTQDKIDYAVSLYDSKKLYSKLDNEAHIHYALESAVVSAKQDLLQAQQKLLLSRYDEYARIGGQ